MEIQTGDQHTAARAWQAIDARVNSRGQREGLRGLVPYACDWHAKVNYYYVLTLPTPLSSRSCGTDSTTLAQVRTTSAEERRNIGKDILTE